MNCHDAKTRLDDWNPEADDVLSPDVAAHLEECVDCRGFRDRLAALHDPGSALPQEIQPRRDLWPGIASRLDEPEARWTRFAPLVVPLAAAAGIAAIAIVGAFSLFSPEDSTVAAVPRGSSETVANTAPARLPAAQVEIGFVQTRAVLVRMVEARKSTLTSEQVAALEHTLSTIDSAAQDLHAALNFDPYNPSLLFKLSYTRRSEIRVLQQAIL